MAWNLMHDMEQRIDELRREILGTGPALTGGAGLGLNIRAPATDMSDEGNEFVVTAELPGVRKKDIQLDVQPDGIRIRAAAESSKEKKDKAWIRRERSSVAYDRYFGLPDEVSPEQASAKFEDGVLTVRIPKIETSKRSGHRVEIS